MLEVEDVGAGDVGGHEVRRELDAVELRAEDVGQRADEQGFRHAGHAFDEGVLAGEDGDERLVHHVLLADDDFGDLFAGVGQKALKLIEVFHARLRYRAREGETSGENAGVGRPPGGEMHGTEIGLTGHLQCFQ